MPAMLRTKTLNDILAQAISPHLSSAFICTPSGSLVAYSTPAATPLLERQAILAANIWATQPYLPPRSAASSESASTPRNSTTAPSKASSASEPITLELQGTTLSMHHLAASNVLLCAFGPPPPSSSAVSRARSPARSHDDAEQRESRRTLSPNSKPDAPDAPDAAHNPSTHPEHLSPTREPPSLNGEAASGHNSTSSAKGEEASTERSGDAPGDDDGSTDQGQAGVVREGDTAKLKAQADALAGKVQKTLGPWRMPAVEIT